MTDPSSVETTLDRLNARAGTPRARRLIRRGNRVIAAFAVWCHDGADFDLTGLRTTQLVLALTGGQRAELRGRTSHRRHETTAGDVRLVSPARSPRITVAGRAATLQIVLADDVIAAASASSPDVGDRAGPRSLAAQALVALRSDTDDERCGRIALQAARQLALGALLTPTMPSRGGLAPRTLQRVCDLMRGRLATAPDRLPDCDELADWAALSKFHFIRAFRDSTGFTPHAWMMERRIEQAYASLLERGSSVGDVAEQTGFASPAHFVSTFRSRNGLTPAALRDSASDILALAS